jgi:hypothetical protein
MLWKGVPELIQRGSQRELPENRGAVRVRIA